MVATPSHHHQLTLTCLTITPDDGLHTVRCDVVVRARKDDILKIPTDMEMAGQLVACQIDYSNDHTQVKFIPPAAS